MIEVMSPRIAVIFYSATGNVAALAEAVAEGARSEGAETRVRPVVERAPAEAIEANKRWKAWVEDNPYSETASLDDLAWADGFALGSPTRFGNVAEQLKAFLDTTGGMWAEGALRDKVGTAFTSASTAHGGLESTILSVNNVLYHWGSIVMPLGYPDMSRMKEFNPYGAAFVAPGGGVGPGEPELHQAHLQGARLARVARAVQAM